MAKKKKPRPQLHVDKRAEYRAYLTTPLWQEKRKMAFDHYGCVCNRCGEYGNDVHHRTYRRVGGKERVEDLEVLCRPCHDAHHKVDKLAHQGKKKRKKSKRSLHIEGAVRYLKPAQKKLMEDEFGKCYTIYAYEKNETGDKVRDRLMELYGLDCLISLSNGGKGSKKDHYQMYGGIFDIIPNKGLPI